MQSKLNSTNVLLVIALTLVWGSSYILMKKALVVFSPVQMAALRITLSFLFTIPFLYKAITTIPTKQFPKITLVGLLGTGIPAFLFAFSMTKINSGVNGVINSLSPLFTVVSGYLFWHIIPKKINFIGVLIGFMGALLLVLSKQHNSAENTILYAILPVIATFCYGTNSNLVKIYFPKVNALHVTAIAMAIIGIPALSFIAFTIPLSITTHPHFYKSFGALLFLSGVGTVISWMLFYKLVQRTDALFAASVTYLIPIVAISWGLYDGEIFTAIQLLGMCLILVGVYFVSRK